MWNIVEESQRNGVAIHNYISTSEHGLELHVGDAVLLLEELGDWYLGCKARNRSVRGVFPKCYIAVRAEEESKLPLVQETTAVLREWGALFKEHYVLNTHIFKNLEVRLSELMQLRSEILSGTLPLDKLREMEHRVATKIDLGNHQLGLDMVVRDANCNILNPESTSTVQLFWQHQKATEDIKKFEHERALRQKTTQNTNQFSHSLFLAVRNFVCKMSDEAELLMSLYDGKENIPFTENYVVRWSHANALNSSRVLFTDLGSRDLVREKVYLVCYVIRIGAMDHKEVEKDSVRRNSHMPARKTSPASTVRRPFGLAAKDITLFMSGKLESDEEKDIVVPFFPCDKDNLEQTLKKALTTPKDNRDSKMQGQGLWVSLKLLHGDFKQVREENPHLMLGNVSISRKMGFPEVILPGDVRNDLYLTLVSGEFSKGAKSSEKNVQVSVTVCDENGVTIPEVIFLGGGVEGLTEFRSVVYYHEDKPKWNEIFKVSVPIEDFKGAHIKFLFRHRSSTEAKDKVEKPFAMSFVKLMQENGTTLKDVIHPLNVYKIEHKKFDESDVSYLSLPWSRTDQKNERREEKCAGLTLSPKDSFCISTNVCSTKLTQNVDLLGLLNWSDKTDLLEHSLKSLTSVDGEEVVKYLQDVLDALFNILMQNCDSELYDEIVFDCLLFIIGLVADRKYQHFEPVLDVYIQESFSATLAYNKLIIVLKCHINNVLLEDRREFSLKLMKSLQYIFRFIVRSRLLFSELYGGKGQEQFDEQLRSLLQSIVQLTRNEQQHLVIIQGACLKYFPSAVQDIIRVYNPRELSLIFADMISGIPIQRLVKQKMMTVNDIVKGPLFLIPEARAVLLPAILAMLKTLLEAKEEGPGLLQQTKSAEKVSRVLGASRANLVKAPYCRETEVELCVKVLSDIMELLFRTDIGPTFHDVSEVMLNVLRTVIQASIALDRNHANQMPLVVIMLSIFRQMTAQHFETYLKHFKTNIDRMDFLMEILLVFKDLVSRPVFPKDWCEMIMLQNSVILKSLRFFSHTIRDYFFHSFEHQSWNNFFHCAIAFLTQPALQLENFSLNKRLRVIARYKDMRRETALEIRSMWFNLGQYKIQFVPGLVGAVLEMTLIPEIELRTWTIPIFFDMMQCEYYSSKNSQASYFTKRDSACIKGNFSEFENEMIAKLDVLFEGGCGDSDYKDLFRVTMLKLCEDHSSFKTQGVKFVKTVSRLMERLLEYRMIITDENKENRMSCVVNLLDFYSEINRKEMYIRYVNKLCELHLECDNYTEAAFTLKLHSTLLNWTDDMLSPHLKSHKHPLCHTHLQLKEILYEDMIRYFDKGKMWECALTLCNELKEQYEHHLYDYGLLSQLYIKMAKFYDSIMKQIRHVPEYFRVGFYGMGFPVYLQNKVFIYRGREYERLIDFCSRIQNHFPNAELLSKLEPPGSDITEANVQCLQINKVDPLMDERKSKLPSSRAPEQILRYHRFNDVNRFQFSRPVYLTETNKEFGNLWLERTVMVTTYHLPGILMWFPVASSKTFMVSPIENAIETMTQSNKTLWELITSHSEDDNLPLNPLSMKLNGVVDPAVMGGIANYEKAFLTPEYLEGHPEEEAMIEQLKRVISELVPVVERGIQIHGTRITPSLAPFHARLEECFTELKNNIQAKYGVVNESDLKYRRSTSSLRRQFSTISNSSYSSETRNSYATSEASTSSSTLKNLISMKPPSLSTSTLRSKDKGKEKRKSKGNVKDAPSPGGSLWYTGPEISSVSTGNQTVYELRQELQSKRPLRSEVEKEKRLSRPTSGQFRMGGVNPAGRFSQISGNRDSTGTTESTTSEDDPTPPPLPVKQRDADYCNLPVTNGRSSFAPPKPPL